MGLHDNGIGHVVQSLKTRYDALLVVVHILVI